MEETKEKSRYGTLWRFAALILAAILVFHLASPAANAIADGRKRAETVPTTVAATEAATEALTATDYLYLAEDAIAKNDYDLAYSRLSEAENLMENQDDSALIADIQVKMVSVQILQEKYPEAIESIERFQSEQMPSAQEDLAGILEFLKGGCLTQLGEYKAAIDAYDSAAELGYDKAICLEQILTLRFELGEYESVTAVGESLLALENVSLHDPALVFQELGISNVYLSQFETALDYLEKANQETGQLQGNGYYRGICLMSLDRTDEAIEAFTASIESDELPAYCYYNRGVCYLNLNDLEKAKADMEMTLELEAEPDMLEAAQAVLQQIP